MGVCDKGGGWRVSCCNNLQFDNAIQSSLVLLWNFLYSISFAFFMSYEFHSVLVTKCCFSTPSFLLTWTPATSTWIRSFCPDRWYSLLIVTLVMTNNIFAYVLWSRENEICVSKNKSLKGRCFISIPMQARGILCATLKSWAALSIILINKHINKKYLGFLSSDVLHSNAYAL